MFSLSPNSSPSAHTIASYSSHSKKTKSREPSLNNLLRLLPTNKKIHNSLMSTTQSGEDLRSTKQRCDVYSLRFLYYTLTLILKSKEKNGVGWLKHLVCLLNLCPHS